MSCEGNWVAEAAQEQADLGPSPLPPGTFVVVAGPDGSGKSSLAAALAARAPQAGHLWLHHRPRLLYSRTPTSGPPVTDPYGRAPYSRLLSALKVCYYFADYVLGWWLRARPLLRAGGAVVLERGWDDLRVDPLRYRLAGVDRLVALLGRLLPRPTLTVVLDADESVLLARTDDQLDLADLRGQRAAFRRAYAGRHTSVVLDASQPPADLERQALAALAGR